MIRRHLQKPSKVKEKAVTHRNLKQASSTNQVSNETIEEFVVDDSMTTIQRVQPSSNPRQSPVPRFRHILFAKSLYPQKFIKQNKRKISEPVDRSLKRESETKEKLTIQSSTYESQKGLSAFPSQYVDDEICDKEFKGFGNVPYEYRSTKGWQSLACHFRNQWQNPSLQERLTTNLDRNWDLEFHIKDKVIEFEIQKHLSERPPLIVYQMNFKPFVLYPFEQDGNLINDFYCLDCANAFVCFNGNQIYVETPRQPTLEPKMNIPGFGGINSILLPSEAQDISIRRRR
eukprot:GHVP01030359.1.p1 GENE.GHVP01030359.1~~GHVP01030359.1.p1  ORF type:complete len:287 (-),score=41.29 GHVP01030359.1:583-1443(-)